MPRKYRERSEALPDYLKGFNEAGADAPEIPRNLFCASRFLASFNEAGADAPEIPRQHGPGLAGMGR